MGNERNDFRHAGTELDTARTAHDPEALTDLEAVSCALAANPVLSRRSFVSAAAVVGTLTFLGSTTFASGTRVNAYADEGGNTHFSIYVLSREEVPIMAMRETDSGKVAVGGVNVTVTSLFNQKQVSVTTDDDGFAVINVRALSFQCDDDSAPQYSFYGEVLATADGCRDVFFPQTIITSGVTADEDGVRINTIEIPVEADDGSAYLRCVALDGMDALHNGEPAAVGDYNDIDHEFFVQVATINERASVQVALFIDDKEVARQAATRDADAPKLAKTTFTDKYLRIIEPGQKVKIWFSAEGEAARSATLAIEFVKAIVAKGGLDDSMALTVAFDPDGKNEKRWDCLINWLFDMQDTFYLGIPGFPVDIFDDPFGNFGISVTIGTFTAYKSVNGENKTPEQAFKWGGGRWMSEGFSNLQKTFKDSWANDKQAYAGAGSNNLWSGASSITRTITAQMDFTLLGFGTCEEVSDGQTKGTFDFGAAFKIGVDGSIGSQVVFLYVPFYWNFDWKVFVQARLTAGAAFDNWFKNLQWNHHYAGDFAMQFLFVICAEAGMTAAVGLRGIFGIGLRGYFKVMLTLAFDASSPKTILHAKLWVEANLQVVLQSIICSKAIPIWPEPWYYTFVDTDKGIPSALASAQLNMMEALKNIDFSDAKMFTQEALGAAAEYKATMNDSARFTAGKKTLATADGEITVEATSPATYTRTRLRAPEGPVLVTPGSDDAPGFANPYAALSEGGKLRAGFTGTSDLAQTGTQDDFAEVSTYNPHLGLVPCEQKVIYKDVYSNTRLRTVSAYPRPNVEPERHTVMTRLVTAKIPSGDNTYARSRICLRPWDANAHEFAEEQIIDFDIKGVLPENRHDVDFDYEVHVDPGSADFDEMTYVTFAITSILAEGDEEFSYEEAVSRQFITFVVWSVDAGIPVYVQSLKSKLDEGVATYHPRAIIQKSIGSGGSTGWVQGRRCCFYYFHDKPGSEEESGIYVTVLNMLGLYVKNLDLALAANTNVAFPVSNRDLIKGTFEVASEEESAYISEGVYDSRLHTILAWSGTIGENDSASFVRSFRFDGPEMECDDQVTVDDATSFARRQHEASDVAFTYFQQSSVVREKKNNVVRFDPTTHKIIAGEVDGYSTESDCIATADGKRLYTVHINDGAPSGSALDDDAAERLAGGAEFYSATHYNAETGANFGGSSLTNTVAEPVYQLFESRWIESLGAYHEFYPVARLAFPPDNVDVLTCSGGKRDFVMASVTDAEAAKCDVYQVSVPDVLAIQCEDVKSESPFAAPGSIVGFYVDVSNVGNALITGFTVTVTDESGKVVHEQPYSDLREYYQPCAENYHTVRDENEVPLKNADGTIKAELVEDIRDTSGILWPGFRRTYRFSFTMPEGHEGSTEFEVHLSNPRSNPYANDASAESVLASVTAAKASLAALAGVDEEPAVLCAEAEHLSWLEADEFSESLFGASAQQVVDPRGRTLAFEAQEASGAASGFTAVPAKYEVEGKQTPIDNGSKGTPVDDKGNGAGGNGAGGNGNGSGGTSSAGKTAAKTGDGLTAATVAAAAVAVGAAGVAAKAAKESAEE